MQFDKLVGLQSKDLTLVAPALRSTFSKTCVPTDEQAQSYIAMLSSTASLKGDVAAGSIFDFSLAAEAARELAQKK